MDSLTSLLLVLAWTGIVQGQGQPDDDDYGDVACEPTMADSCFSDVADDLRFTFDPVNNFIQSTNDSALQDLCNAWEDSLNCTGDIIDSSCRDEDGRLQFDAWNEGLKRVVNFLCTDDRNNLKAIADAVRCWSIVKFLQCIEDKASLVSIATLLNTPLDREECNILQNAIGDCNIQASNPQCMESRIIVVTLQAGSDAFFDHVDCETPRYSKQKGSDVVLMAMAPATATLHVVTAVLLIVLSVFLLT